MNLPLLERLHKIQSHLEAYDEHALNCDCHLCEALDQVGVAITQERARVYPDPEQKPVMPGYWTQP